MNFTCCKVITTFILVVSSIGVHAQSDPGKVEADSLVALPERYPSFPGGPEAWRTFLQLNLDARVAMDNGAPSGRYTVKVRFIVDKEGAVSNIQPLTSFGYGMEQAVMNLILKSKKWVPGWQRGRTVKTFMMQSVIFVVNEE